LYVAALSAVAPARHQAAKPHDPAGSLHEGKPLPNRRISKGVPLPGVRAKGTPVEIKHLLNFAYYSDSPIGAATVRERSRWCMSVTVLCEPL